MSWWRDWLGIVLMLVIVGDIVLYRVEEIVEFVVRVLVFVSCYYLECVYIWSYLGNSEKGEICKGVLLVWCVKVGIRLECEWGRIVWCDCWWLRMKFVFKMIGCVLM